MKFKRKKRRPEFRGTKDLCKYRMEQACLDNDSFGKALDILACAPGAKDMMRLSDQINELSG